MDTSLLSQPEIFTHPGFIGGMIGAFVGIIGGLFGTYRSYQHATSRAARRWIIIYAILIILICAGFTWAFLAAQAAHRIYYQIGFFILLGPIIKTSIFHLNRLNQRGETQ